MQPEFKIGDMAVYPAQGVAEITGIETKEIGGNMAMFYVLRVLESNKKIMVPIKKANAIGLRGLIGAEEIAEIYGILEEPSERDDGQTWNRRYRRYLEKIKSGSINDIAEVLRDLSHLKYVKTLSFGERKMLDTARALLVKEISISKGMDEEAVEAEIETILKPEGIETEGEGGAQAAP